MQGNKNFRAKADIWWLKQTTSRDGELAPGVFPNGNILEYIKFYGASFGVRPALWINKKP